MEGLEFRPYKAIVPGSIYRGEQEGEVMPIVLLARYQDPKPSQATAYLIDMVKNISLADKTAPNDDLELYPEKAVRFLVSNLPRALIDPIRAESPDEIKHIAEHMQELGLDKSAGKHFISVQYGLIPVSKVKENKGSKVLHNQGFYERLMPKVRNGLDNWQFRLGLDSGLAMPTKGKVDKLLEEPDRNSDILQVRRADFYDYPRIAKMINLLYDNLGASSIGKVEDTSQLRLAVAAGKGLQDYLECMVKGKIAGTLIKGIGPLEDLLKGLLLQNPEQDKPEKREDSGTDSFAV